MTWIIYALLSAVFAALVAIFGKIGISKVDTTLATTIRAVVMALFFLIVSLALNKFKLVDTVDKRAITFITLSGVAGALSWLFYFFSLKSGPASAVAALDRTSVVFVFILAVLFLGEKFGLRSAVGALLITVGAILMSLKWSHMVSKPLLMVGMVLGSTLGAYVPMLWGVSAFSFTSILFSLLGGIIGIWGAYRISKQLF